MNKHTIAATDLCLPSPRVGSIDTYSGFGPTSKLAIKAHQHVQTKQHKNHPDYASEVSFMHDLPFKKHIFHITGRMDGLYHESPIRIEEIKTAFDPQKLIELLADNYFTHPYWLQLQLYGYIHWLKTHTMPVLNLLIVSLRNHKKTHSLAIDFNVVAFEDWLERRLTELTQEIQESKKRSQRRKKLSTELLFPFAQPRRYQDDLMVSVASSMLKKKPMLIQAPTGLGKSIAILYPALKESLSRGQKTFYITPKNSQHQIALNTVQLLQDKGASCSSLVLTAKKKLCMKAEPICTSKQCEFADGHYSKCTEHEVLNQVKKQHNLDEAFFKELAKKYQVCPYELQMDSVPFSDVVIGDYNYIFSASNAKARVLNAPLGDHAKPNLVIDEVHNLPSRGMDYFSPMLEVTFFESYLTSLAKYPNSFKKKLKKIINQCITLIHQCALPDVQEPHVTTIPEYLFKAQEEQLSQLLSDYLESDMRIEPDDPILRLCNYWSDFTAALEFVNQGHDEFFTSFHPRHNRLKITCCDASGFLKEHYDNFQQIIGFSATLKPFAYYSQLVGLNKPNLNTQEFSSPFSAKRRKLVLIPQVSTKYRDRAASYVRIREVIQRITAIKPGNYFIFFPSFDFLEQIFRLMPTTQHFTLLRQERKMDAGVVKALLNKLHQSDKNHLFFAVQGGTFAEGIDYKGELAIGAFIIGPPIPTFDWEREQMKKYYQSLYQQGMEFAYIYPAMAKAIQAAGRVIRTETDKGLIVLLDNRFLNSTYSQCMPKDWFINRPQELMSTAILQDVASFWGNDEGIDLPVQILAEIL